MMICALQTGLSRFTFGSKLELEVSNLYFEDGSDGDYLDSKLRSRWIFLITGIDSARPGSRTAVSLFLPIRLKSSIGFRSLPLVCFGAGGKQDWFWYVSPSHKT